MLAPPLLILGGRDDEPMARRAEDLAAVDQVDLGVYVAQAQIDWLATEPERRERTLVGSLVFADVSGFTPLTERLARQGRVGAERLTEVLNDVFGRLLGAAGRHGGDLLKFGGDALLLLFRDDGHEGRAVAAAAAMQDELRHFRRLRTEAGVVSLQMSVGVASGPVQALLVGESHRELLAVGPVVSETARLEAAAAAGEVLMSAATAAALGPTALGAAKDDGVLLRSAPGVTLAGLSRRAHRVECDLCVPASIRPHLSGRSEGGEHRLAVLAFVQFKGSDDLLENAGPEVVAEELHRLIVAAQDACAAHGVSFLATDLDRNGGKLVLAAGAPVATPDDEDRMLFAAREIVSTPTRLTVRAGVNRGYAFAVDMGSPDRRTYAVMGDATNLAARVMGRAGPGQVLATAAVLDHVGTEFALEPVEPFMVKGKSAPVSAAVVGPPMGRRRRDQSAPFTGRADELVRLESALAAVRQGGGQIVEIIGEPGIGKTCLLDALIRRSEGRPVVEVVGGVYARNSPYFALRSAVRRLVGADPSAPPEVAEAALRGTVAQRAPQLVPWLPLVDVLVGLDLPATPEVDALDPRFRAVRLHAVAAELLDALLPEGTLVIVDDAQWVDEASAALLGYLMNGIAERPWLVCISRRDGEGGLRAPEATRSDVVSLGGIDEAASTALVAALVSNAGASLAPPVRAELVQRGGGNPMLLVELTGSVLSGGRVAELPDSVEGLLAARLDVLAPSDRAILRRAAVLGSRFPVEHLAAMADLPRSDVDAAVDRLHAFLRRGEGDRVAFGQPLLREVAYASLPFRLRRELHGRAASLIEQQDGGRLEWADLLSLHYSEADVPDAAWECAVLAGRRARASAAALDAAVFFERALVASRRLPNLAPDAVAAVWEELAEVAELGGRYELAASALGRARRLRSGDPIAVADLCGREGRLRERSGRAREALGWYTRGHRTLDGIESAIGEAGRSAERVRLELNLRYAGTRLRQGRPVAGVSVLEDVVRRAEDLGDRALLAHACYLLDWAYSDLGRPEAVRYRERALPIYEELGDHGGQANVLNNLGVAAYFEGRWEEALALYERSRQARQRAGDLVEMGTAANNIGEILSDQGHLERAEDEFREALDIWRPSAFHVGVGLATSNLGRAAARAGRFDEARHRLGDAVTLLSSVGAESLALEARARAVECLVLSGDPGAMDEAEDALRRAARLGGQGLLMAMLERLAGYALLQAGELEAALGRLRSALDRAERASAPFEVALTYEALARAVPGDPGFQRSAVEGLARLGVKMSPKVPLPSP